ncbi:uncharacterized protein LOC101855238 [Aplysia californica]|uniref:beta-N-acetylhexosaminidase n=1 Tax=Aplysia californica TaxID=6500 RepID=A0ABM0JGQ7_APLCA|nr:uncharacterized protein LOC101855238 [Aplysia californica]
MTGRRELSPLLPRRPEEYRPSSSTLVSPFCSSLLSRSSRSALSSSLSSPTPWRAVMLLSLVSLSLFLVPASAVEDLRLNAGNVKRRDVISNININNVNNVNNDGGVAQVRRRNNGVPQIPKRPAEDVVKPAKKVLAPAIQRAQENQAELNRQLEEHERQVAQQQAEMAGREKRRQERQRQLDIQRADNLRQELEQKQRDKERQELSRQRERQREKEREQQWLEDMKKKAEDQMKLQQQQELAVKELKARKELEGAGLPGGNKLRSGEVPALKNAGPMLNEEEKSPQQDVRKQFDAEGLLSKKDLGRDSVRNVAGAGLETRDRQKNAGVDLPAGNNGENVANQAQAEPPNPVQHDNPAANQDALKVVARVPEPGEKLPGSDNEIPRSERDAGDQINNNAELPNLPQQVPNVLSNNDNSQVNNNDNDNMGGGGNNNQNQQYQNMNDDSNRRDRDQPQIGGLHLSWDWEDFSIMFSNYGNAEMKVRRAPHPTTGEPWPMPQYYSKKDKKVYKVSKDLRFVPTGVKCDILDEAIVRHLQRVLRGAVEDMYDNLQHAEGTFVDDPSLKYDSEEYVKAPTISRVEIKVRKACEKYPTLDSDESYDLVVKKKKTYIWANEVWGAMRGLETLGQLVWKGTDGLLYIKETVISDYPRFPHRGLHIDTSRHFLFKEIILDIIESMEMNKLNVFHWHIVDDQSFPYESKVYPELSRKGAFHPTYVYSLEDIAEIIEYARVRGVRVMPEFDTPGHTYAWGLSRPELLTQCYSGSTPVKGYLGPIDPSKNSTYRFLQTLFQEIMGVFKDQYLHLGGDEVPLGCWQSNPEVMAFATELSKKSSGRSQQQAGSSFYNSNFGWNNVWSEDVKMVYEYYVNRLIKILNDLGHKRKKGVRYIMWQEVMNNNLQLPNDTIIQVWMGDMADVMRATSMGYQVLYSTCWYLDHVEYGTKWPKYYNCDPVDQSYGYHIDEKKVLGGEIAFWSEYFSNENLIPLMWPRASAAAERLWSSKDVKNLDKAAERLSEHRCRMIKRGVNAGEISGPGYCLHPPPRRRVLNDTLGCKGGNCSRTHNFVQIEDIELHVSQRGGSLADCGHVFSRANNNVMVMLALALVVVLALLALSRSSSRLHRLRLCRNRSILIVFVIVLLVYFLCYTTIWIRAFEFSGSFHKTLQEDSPGGESGGKGGGGVGDMSHDTGAGGGGGGVKYSKAHRS